MSSGRRETPNPNADPADVAREILQGGQTSESDTNDSDDDGSEERGQSGTKGTGSAG
ncbi:MAG TPA: hypothetical protein PKI49_05530 [Pseudomonadota bacterium]|jgi:hypothetical protein|nr:hypothetical protein [Pseudomonadota bacterium]HNI59165.1 hypothetical protein [Pseudomonadota bacterium]HNK43303.1 hypothetical protein [Pseudomonadota bacterium]HNN51694.1 hypothetical protein [Pseudomonadota bacterium]HNO67951.1 hypothetical protein [Pseudomonadota bacterium]